ncbi:MAG TPA: phosphate acyltransferase PlsX [Coleofasciculaceae cyanobacterium]|jgi:glycerol-3-phosphate acyltransferase PlsX
MVSNPVRIAVDAMGGDFAPHEIVDGAIQGSRESGVTVLLVGRADQIEAELAKHDTQGASYEVIPASEVVAMDEAATEVRRKRDASISVTAKCVKSGQAQGMVAAGSTGAAMAAATLYIGRIDGVDRAAIGVVLPSAAEPCLLIDAGANADCTPEMLTQFGVMGNIYMHNVYNVEQPRVGLLNIGEEQSKGNAFAHAAFQLLERDPRFHFIGNIEGRDLFNGGADVAVTDGFTGNVALKSAEGVMRMFKTILKAELMRDFRSKMGALMVKPYLAGAGKRVDPEEFGGALLLGVNGICVISHGGSRARGIKNAIRVAKESVDAGVLQKISSQIREGVGTHEPAQ